MSTDTSDGDILLDLAGAARSLKISERQLKDMASGGRLPEGVVVRLGRRRLFSPRALREWVARGCPPPGRKGRR